jgi:hypothetical protein
VQTWDPWTKKLPYENPPPSLRMVQKRMLMKAASVKVWQVRAQLTTSSSLLQGLEDNKLLQQNL